MTFYMINEPFRCENCGAEVSAHPEGSARNHCPKCLFSLHVDETFPGDRASECGALMKPADLEIRKGRGYVIVHECVKCGKRIVNKTASDDEIVAFMEERAKRLENELPKRAW